MAGATATGPLAELANARGERPAGGPHAENVCAVVVSYNPRPALLDTLNDLLPQVANLVVVDNGSGPGARDLLAEVRAAGSVTLLENRRNLGVAAALNQGAVAARAFGSTWLAMFDQDSRAPSTFLQGIATAYRAHPDRERVALIAPSYRDEKTDIVQSFARRGAALGGCREVEVTLTSGSVARLDVFLALGGFDEGYFIDYVDIEYCLRCRRSGFVVLEAPGVELLHNLGDSVRRRFLWKEFGVTNHEPFRRYYMARNRVLTYRRYWRTEPRWVVRDLFSLLRENVKIVGYEREVLRKLTAGARGLFDGLRGRTGPAS